MGFFKAVHDIVGINKNKMAGSISGVAKKMKKQGDKLRNCEKVRKFKPR